MTDTALERNFIRAGEEVRPLPGLVGARCIGRARWQTYWRGRLCVLVAVLIFGVPYRVMAAPLVFLVQAPVWPETAARFDAQPFAERLSSALGQQVEVRRSDDVLSHWRTVRSGRGFELVLDEAHFTAYRLSHHDFTVLAQTQSEVRYAVVVRPRTLITAPSDLSARRVASPAPPALAALRLLNLFPDPVHAPALQIVSGRDAALRALAAGEVSAAILPMADAETLDGVQIALETDASPGRAFSVSGAISDAQRRKLLELFRELGASAAGRQVFSRLAVNRLEPVSGNVYEDAEQLLKGTWGY